MGPAVTYLQIKLFHCFGDQAEKVAAPNDLLLELALPPKLTNT